MIRVAIVSDTHGHLDHRIEALAASCDIAVHGGDIGNAGVLARLQPRSGRVYAVIGNNDIARKWPEQDRGLLGSLPDLARVALPGGELVVVHGHRLQAAGRHGRLRERYPGARVIVYGHSHRLVADRDTRPWVLNPGAAGRARTYGGPSCMVLSVCEREWTLSVHRFEPATAVRRPMTRKQQTAARPASREQRGKSE